jgi:hypothetical protein
MGHERVAPHSGSETWAGAHRLRLPTFQSHTRGRRVV